MLSLFSCFKYMLYYYFLSGMHSIGPQRLIWFSIWEMVVTWKVYYLFAVEVVFLQLCLFEEIQVVTRGGWLHDRKFLLCSYLFKIKIFASQNLLEYLFIYLYILLSFQCKIKLCGTKILSYTASGGIKLEWVEKKSASSLSCCLWSHLHESKGGRKCYCFVMSNTEK